MSAYTDVFKICSIMPDIDTIGHGHQLTPVRLCNAFRTNPSAWTYYEILRVNDVLF